MASSSQWISLLERSNIAKGDRLLVQLPFGVIKTLDREITTVMFRKDLRIDENAIHLPDGQVIPWEVITYLILRMDIGAPYKFISKQKERFSMQDDNLGTQSKWIKLLEQRGIVRDGKINDRLGMLSLDAGTTFDFINHPHHPFLPHSYDEDFLYVQNQYGIQAAIPWDQITSIMFP